MISELIHGEFHPTPLTCCCKGEGWVTGAVRDVPCPYHAAQELIGQLTEAEREAELGESFDEGVDEGAEEREAEVRDLEDRVIKLTVAAKELIGSPGDVGAISDLKDAIFAHGMTSEDRAQPTT